MSASFMVAIRVDGDFKNVGISLSRERDWPRFGVSPAYSGITREVAYNACREINALLHAGFPLDALIAAALLSQSNHAEILRACAERLQQQAAA